MVDHPVARVRRLTARLPLSSAGNGNAARPVHITDTIRPVHQFPNRLWFDCVGDDFKLIEADALKWVSRQRRHFDGSVQQGR